jgi:hypothetical protein
MKGDFKKQCFLIKSPPAFWQAGSPLFAKEGERKTRNSPAQLLDVSKNILILGHLILI